MLDDELDAMIEDTFTQFPDMGLHLTQCQLANMISFSVTNVPMKGSFVFPMVCDAYLAGVPFNVVGITTAAMVSSLLWLP